jgi:hypothetical protein
MPLLTLQSAKGYGFGKYEAPAAAGAYESIMSSAGGSNVITLNSIPSTYKHLQLRMTMKDTSGSTGIAEYYIRFNGDTTGSNYWKHRFYANGSTTVQQDSSVGSEGIWGTHYPRSASDGWGISIVDIPNYSDTSIYKAIAMYGGGGASGTSNMAFGWGSGQWKSTSAINSITIESNQAGFSSSSVFALYGIKG